MNLSKITLIGRSTVQLPIFGALPSDPFVLKSADGFGSEVDVLISNSGYVQGRRPRNKELVLRIGFNPNYTLGQRAADLRTELYRMLNIPLGAPILIQLRNLQNEVEMQIQGHVKTLDPVLFTKEPEAQLVVSCVSPYFHAPIEWGFNVVSEYETQIDNPGTAPAGFFMEMVVQNYANPFLLTSAQGDRIALHRLFSAGDVLTLDTRPGWKSVLFNGTNIIQTMDAYSPWFTLHNGLNVFTTNVPVVWNLAHTKPLYWGV